MISNQCAICYKYGCLGGCTIIGYPNTGSYTFPPSFPALTISGYSDEELEKELKQRKLHKVENLITTIKSKLKVLETEDIDALKSELLLLGEQLSKLK